MLWTYWPITTKQSKSIPTKVWQTLRTHTVWLYSSPISGGYSLSQSTTSSSSRIMTWHSRSPLCADATINGRIKSSRNTSNWHRAPSLLSSWSRPPVYTMNEKNFKKTSTCSAPKKLTQILTSNGGGIERNQKIITSFPKLLHRDRWWTSYDSIAIETEKTA